MTSGDGPAVAACRCLFLSRPEAFNYSRQMLSRAVGHLDESELHSQDETFTSLSVRVYSPHLFFSSRLLHFCQVTTSTSMKATAVFFRRYYFFCPVRSCHGAVSS